MEMLFQTVIHCQTGGEYIRIALWIYGLALRSLKYCAGLNHFGEKKTHCNYDYYTTVFKSIPYLTTDKLIAIQFILNMSRSINIIVESREAQQ